MPHEFEALAGVPRSSAFPQPVTANGTTIPVAGLAFDASTEEATFFRFRASDYVSGDVAVDLEWYADTASSGAVVWGAQLAAITPDTDTHLGTTGQRLHRATITLTGAALDSLAANDHCALRIARVAANGSDTMLGDAILTYVSVAA